MKNILVTGGCGFIAGGVIDHILEQYDYRIVNLDKLDYCSYQRPINKPNYKFIKGDILSVDLVNFILEEEKIDVIMHFAAQTHVDNSFGNSIEFTRNNILGTHVLLESAKQYGIKKFIHVSTDEVYGEMSDKAKESETILDPTNPYAATKAGAEFLVKAYHKSFGLPVIITRSNNIYGPGQFPEKVIPKFINLLERGEKLCIHGSGENVRNYLYITDVAKAFDLILHKGKIGEIYNIGTDFELNNRELANKLLQIYGLENSMIKYVEDRKFNDKRYSIDSSKLEKLGWSIDVTFDEGLEKTIRWYKDNSSVWNNIERYLKPHPNN